LCTNFAPLTALPAKRVDLFLKLRNSVADAATIDLAMILGTGWGPHRGGPLRYADDRGLADVVQATLLLATLALLRLTRLLLRLFTPGARLRFGLFDGGN